ncbi:MAG: histidine phosphatase family protein [Clostridia bacterium]|nr:histidine phosphatase family protein [Clostridia bacterium]
MIYLLRHGQTDLNRSQILQGRSNYPLNETGIAQAEQTGAWVRENGLSFAHVISSPLCRAVQTARIVTGSSEIETDDRLLEMDYGPYDGIDMKNPPPEIRRFFGDILHTPAPEGMESLEALVHRMGRFLEAVRPLAEEGNLLLSTHAVAMKGALEYLSPDSHGSYWNRHLPNCGLYVFDLTENGFTLPQEVLI